MASNKNIFITAFILLLSVLFFGFSSIDEQIQDLFYNYDTHRWLLPSYLQPYKFIFYDGIKEFLIFISILFLFSLAFIKLSKTINSYKKGIMVVVFSAVLIPSIVGALKAQTDMPCPRDEIIYGGLYPQTKVWECYPDDVLSKGHPLKCWPAGHASGGFALMSLFFLFKKRKNQYIGLGIGLVVGWSMGIYKMLIGDHFFSHTFITMVLAWLVILITAKLLNTQKAD